MPHKSGLDTHTTAPHHTIDIIQTFMCFWCEVHTCAACARCFSDPTENTLAFIILDIWLCVALKCTLHTHCNYIDPVRARSHRLLCAVVASNAQIMELMALGQKVHVQCTPPTPPLIPDDDDDPVLIKSPCHPRTANRYRGAPVSTIPGRPQSRDTRCAAAHKFIRYLHIIGSLNVCVCV